VVESTLSWEQKRVSTDFHGKRKVYAFRVLEELLKFIQICCKYKNIQKFKDL
jgi:hypothetical protein